MSLSLLTHTIVGLFVAGLVFAAPAEPVADVQEVGARAPAAGPDAPTKQAAPGSSDSAAIDRGRLLYGFYCMSCHGGDGRGGVDGGSDLRESEMLTAGDGGSAFAAFLPEGRPDQRMPATPLAEHEIADLWAFLQVLVPPPVAEPASEEPVVGDLQAGQRAFRTAGCAGCHSVTGDLAKIGARLDVSAIHQRLLRPPAGSGAAPARSESASADALRRHTESVKKLGAQAVRDLAVYLATLR